jgi:HlyD family secretion protein
MLRTDSTSIQTTLNEERLAVTDIMRKWFETLPQLSSSTIVTDYLKVNGYVGIVKVLMADLSSAIQKLTPGNSGLSQSVIDGYISTLNTAVTTFNSAVDSLALAENALAIAQSSYDLATAGKSSETVQAQQAKVNQAVALVNDSRIYAPIDGVITKANPEVGEYVTVGTAGFAVQTDGGYKIEAYIPEADIAKVKIGDKADVTLDAYGPYVIFPATVSASDLAETVREGVPTYKVTLIFDNADPRIRSGMTANTEILTAKATGVLVVPTRAVVDDNGKKSVRLVSADGSKYAPVPVTTGLKGSDGTTEIVGGVAEGDKVVTYVK